MARPDTDNGYTRIANEILEALAGIRIPGEARQCLDVILRKTYGFQKKSDAISLSQFEGLTKLKKPAIVKCIRKLQSYNLIITEKKWGCPANVYSLNKDHDTWKPLPKKIMKKVRKPSLLPFCYVCGFDEALHKHHIQPINQGGSNEIGNKINLCPNCHALAHRGKITPDFLVAQKDNIRNIAQKDNENLPKSKSSFPFLPHTKETITKETITKESICSSTLFEQLWTNYPKRVGKKQALRHFLASVKTEQDSTRIQTALKNYLQSERVAKGFIQNGSTWFNNWQDWVDFKEEVCPTCQNKGFLRGYSPQGGGYDYACKCDAGMKWKIEKGGKT